MSGETHNGAAGEGERERKREREGESDRVSESERVNARMPYQSVVNLKFIAVSKSLYHEFHTHLR